LSFIQKTIFFILIGMTAVWAEPVQTVSFSVSGKGNLNALIKEALILNVEAQLPQPQPLWNQNIEKINWPELAPGKWVIGEIPGISKSFLLSYKEAPQPVRTEMWLSNTPEKVNSNGLLKTFHLGGFSRHRLMYYHHNTHSKDLYFQVYLKNESTLDAVIYLNRAVGGPSMDEIFTGDIAMKRFWQNKINNYFFSVTLPAGRALKVVSQKLKPKHVISGMMEMIPEDSNPSLGVFILTTENPQIDTVQFPFHEPDQRVDGVFEIYQTKIAHRFLSKDPSLKIRLGEIPVIKNNKNEILKGNYGLEYQISLEVENVATANKQLQGNFCPAGGIAAATFLLDDQMISLGGVPARQKKEFLKQMFLPGEKRIYKINFMPQAGANYPVDLEFNWL
jgi:hypothetical protein